MELLTQRCTQCMGEVEPMGDGIHAKCSYCGAVYLLPDNERAAFQGDGTFDGGEGDEDGGVDLEAIVANVMEPMRGQLTSSLWGAEVEQKSGAARKFFGIPHDDYIFYILDTTIFGSCKVGLALTTSGICMKDEDGAVRCVSWDELLQLDFSYRDGTLFIDGSQFYSSDGMYVVEVLHRVQSAFTQGGDDGSFDLEAIVANVMNPVRNELIGSLWGARVEEKARAARKFFGIPRDDSIYYILDTTVFGSCKVGLAFATSGIHMKDEDGAVRCIGWDELHDQTNFSYGGGTLYIDGSEFFSSDGEYVVDVLNSVRAAW